MRNLKIQLYWSRWYFVITAIVLLYSLIWVYLVPHVSRYQGTETTIIGRVQAQTITEKGSTITMVGKEPVKVWTKKSTAYPLGSIIQVVGELEPPTNNTIPNQFNYKKYLRNQQIFYQINAKQIQLLQYRPTMVERIKQSMMNRINQQQSQRYLKTFILGDKHDIEPTILDSYRHNGMSHLFALSGMHISFLTMSLDASLKRLKWKKKTRYVLISSVLLGYIFIVGKIPSLYRAVFSYFLYAFNEYYQLSLSPLKRLCIVFNLVLLMNPYYLFDLGFQYSFLIVFFLNLARPFINRWTNPMLKLFVGSILAFLVSIPLTIFYFSEINLLSPFINFLMVPFVTYLFFPISLLCFFVPILDPIVLVLANILEQISIVWDTTCRLSIIFAKPPWRLLFLEYSFMTLSFYSSRHILIVTVLLIGNWILPMLNPHHFMIFIDVGQGDSTLVVAKHNQCNLLIDTGGKLPKPTQENDTIVMKRTIPLLKSLGITHLDYLILTHADYDHAGEANILVNNFNVKHIITNEGANKFQLENWSSHSRSVAKESNQLVCGKLLFQFLSPNHVDKKENNNSLVIASVMEQSKVIMMADAEETIEKRIIREYNLTNWDILKVGHHGSDTSSSESFLTVINPKTSIISVGKNNRYHHPNPQVMERLKGHHPYLTSIDGSIQITFQKHGYKIHTNPP